MRSTFLLIFLNLVKNFNVMFQIRSSVQMDHDLFKVGDRKEFLHVVEYFNSPVREEIAT
jgi:hypothetical protein